MHAHSICCQEYEFIVQITICVYTPRAFGSIHNVSRLSTTQKQKIDELHFECSFLSKHLLGTKWCVDLIRGSVKQHCSENCTTKKNHVKRYARGSALETGQEEVLCQRLPIEALG